MDRLTSKDVLGNNCITLKRNGKSKWKICEDHFENSYILEGDFVDKLEAYEDTGLNPEQIKEIDKLYREKCEEVAQKLTWIPTNVSLPKNSNPVLCWVRSTTISSGETYIIGSCDKGFWFLQTYEIGHHHMPVKDYEVVAWMPLQECYKE